MRQGELAFFRIQVENCRQVQADEMFTEVVFKNQRWFLEIFAIKNRAQLLIEERLTRPEAEEIIGLARIGKLPRQLREDLLYADCETRIRDVLEKQELSWDYIESHKKELDAEHGGDVARHVVGILLDHGIKVRVVSIDPLWDFGCVDRDTLFLVNGKADCRLRFVQGLTGKKVGYYS